MALRRLTGEFMSTTGTPRFRTFLGLDHMRLTCRYGGRDMRLTDVKGNVTYEVVQ